jgi:uncharacterized membrane protein YiaA
MAKSFAAFTCGGPKCGALSLGGALRSLVLAVLLAFSCSSAMADKGQITQVIGAVMTVVGIYTGNPELVRNGYLLMTAGSATYGLAARRRAKRKAAEPTTVEVSK